MTDDEFIETMKIVSRLAKELFATKRMEPDEFYAKMRRLNSRIEINPKIKNSRDGQIILYNLYQLHMLLQSIPTIERRVANDNTHLRAIN